MTLFELRLLFTWKFLNDSNVLIRLILHSRACTCLCWRPVVNNVWLWQSADSAHPEVTSMVVHPDMTLPSSLFVVNSPTHFVNERLLHSHKELEILRVWATDFKSVVTLGMFRYNLQKKITLLLRNNEVYFPHNLWKIGIFKEKRLSPKPLKKNIHLTMLNSLGFCGIIMELDNWAFIVQEGKARVEGEERARANGEVCWGQWFNSAGPSEDCLFCSYLILSLPSVYSFIIFQRFKEKLRQTKESEHVDVSDNIKFDDKCILHLYKHQLPSIHFVPQYRQRVCPSMQYLCNTILVSTTVMCSVFTAVMQVFALRRQCHCNQLDHVHATPHPCWGLISPRKYRILLLQLFLEYGLFNMVTEVKHLFFK